MSECSTENSPLTRFIEKSGVKSQQHFRARGDSHHESVFRGGRCSPSLEPCQFHTNQTTDRNYVAHSRMLPYDGNLSSKTRHILQGSQDDTSRHPVKDEGLDHNSPFHLGENSIT